VSRAARHRAAGPPRGARGVPALTAVLVLAACLGGVAVVDRLGTAPPAVTSPATTSATTAPAGTPSGPPATSTPPRTAGTAAGPVPTAASVPPSAAAATGPSAPPAPAWALEAPAPEADVRPVALRAPAIDLDVPLGTLGVTADGAIEVPEDPGDAGWLRVGAVPGRTGPAVVAGHVDSAEGPAVFARLGELAAGDVVEVDLDDGTTVTFDVVGTQRHAKDDFPTDAVYGPSPVPALRLITCGGDFDRRASSYVDNVVVFAVAGGAPTGG
jgi:hypothetical protein